MRYAMLLFCLGLCLPGAAWPASEAELSGTPLTLTLPRVRYTPAIGPPRLLWATLRQQATGDGRIAFRLDTWGWLADDGQASGEANLDSALRLSVPQLRYRAANGTAGPLMWAELAWSGGAPVFVAQRYAILDRQAARPLEALRNGVITWYNADGQGHCGFDASPEDLDVAALTQADGLYGNAAWCGACAEVQGPLGSVVVRIVDSCPDCETNHLDLSPQAFAKIARLDDGRVNVQWRFVSCPLAGPVRYRFKEGSSQYWTAIQARNHRLPVVKLEWLQNGAWQEAPRADYNYFIAPQGMGQGRLRLRLTALGGYTVEDSLPAIQENMVLDGVGQFPAP